MDRSKAKFVVVMCLAGASVVIMTLANNGFSITAEAGAVIGGAGAVIGIIALLLKNRKTISFALNVRRKVMTITDQATIRLCGFVEFIAYSNFIVFKSVAGKMTGHAYIQLENLPFGIEQMDKETQYNITSSFSRLLGTFKHPFTYMPICRPVDRKKFIDGIQNKIHNIRIARSVSKVPNPKDEIEEKRMVELLKRLTEGENPMELLWIVQIRESRKTVEEIKAKLDSYTESMIDALSVIHSVQARRLSNAEMIDAVQNYFMLEGQ